MTIQESKLIAELAAMADETAVADAIDSFSFGQHRELNDYLEAILKTEETLRRHCRVLRTSRSDYAQRATDIEKYAWPSGLAMRLQAGKIADLSAREKAVVFLSPLGLSLMHEALLDAYLDLDETGATQKLSEHWQSLLAKALDEAYGREDAAASDVPEIIRVDFRRTQQTLSAVAGGLKASEPVRRTMTFQDDKGRLLAELKLYEDPGNSFSQLTFKTDRGFSFPVGDVEVWTNGKQIERIEKRSEYKYLFELADGQAIFAGAAFELRILPR